MSTINSIQTDDLKLIEQLVKSRRPDLKGSLVYIRTGWENLAFGIEDHIVRLPKNESALNALRREEQFCQYVLGLMPPLATPDLTVHEVGDYPFSLHRKIGSGLFARNEYENLSNFEKEEAAEKLASFFMLMHETPLHYAEETLGAPKRPGPSCYERMAQTVEGRLAPHLKEFGHDILREYRGWQTEKPQLVFGHFDLHDGNVGADSNGRLVGVFDFADCAIGDVHADFAPLFYISPDLAYKTVARYSALTNKAIDPRRIAVAGAMCEISDLAGDRQSPESDEFFNQKLNEWRNTLSGGSRSRGISFQRQFNI
ncbi:MAG: aminoglycoside phosphotransferase family protein [Pseudobdellovibrionaceae bacterium]|jgi:aminoglycoside phosphotransferase (APT) family kinase protein|nr:aminoglycoside phosphotransferase family protein [Pseudobdellovibrionaceae bacterium]